MYLGWVRDSQTCLSDLLFYFHLVICFDHIKCHIYALTRAPIKWFDPQTSGVPGNPSLVRAWEGSFRDSLLDCCFHS